MTPTATLDAESCYRAVKARDRRFDRAVALKLLRPEVATATDARRFRREIAILARLYHPHILQLYDSGVLGPGDGPAGLYYVMPYVRGESLRQRLLRDVRLPVDDAVARDEPLRAGGLLWFATVVVVVVAVAAAVSIVAGRLS